jgi:hypothetical protein
LLADENVSPWFIYYVIVEVCYELPVSISSIYRLYHGKSIAPLYILAFTVHTSVTTGTCIVEIMGWMHLTGAEKLALLCFYVPSLTMKFVMGSDMFSRLEKALKEKEQSDASRKET